MGIKSDLCKKRGRKVDGQKGAKVLRQEKVWFPESRISVQGAWGLVHYEKSPGCEIKLGAPS